MNKFKAENKNEKQQLRESKGENKSKIIRQTKKAYFKKTAEKGTITNKLS